MTTQGPNTDKRLPRSAHVAMAIAVGVAFVGFFIGLGQRHEPSAPEQRPSVYDHTDAAATPRLRTAPQAPSYREIPTAGFRPNDGYTPHLNELPPPAHHDDPLAEVTLDENDRQAAIEARAARRAFDGAPPVIPHLIQQMSAASCLACHATGVQVGDRVASPMSHQHMTNCTQCHVESTNRQFQDDDFAVLVASKFVGVESAGRGERAWEGAPPTIPHTTWMRESCLACHGSLGHPGLQTTHPWRSSCTQCHVSSAELDQRGFSAVQDIFNSMMESAHE